MTTTIMKHSFRSVFKAASRNKSEIAAYTAFLLVALGAAEILRRLDGIRLSSCLSLSAAIQCLGFCLLIMQVNKSTDVSNVSSQSLALFALGLCSRLFATLNYAGYQPLDVAGEKGLYHGLEMTALFLAVVTLGLVGREQAKRHVDSEPTRNVVVLAGICVVLAPLTHGTLNVSFVGDTAWILGLYMETVAMIPQLYMLQRKRAEVDWLHGHYIACTFMARLVAMRFWFECYPELNAHSDYDITGWMVLGAQLLQVCVFADFMYLYVKSIRNNQRLLIEI